MTPAAVLDIILIAVLVISIIVGLARGFIRTLLGVVIFVVALLGSAWIAHAVAQPVTDWALPYVQDFVVQEVTDSVIAPQTAALDSSFFEGLGALAQEMIDSAITAGVTALQGALEGIIHSVVYAVAFCLSLLVLTLLLRLITAPLHLVDRLPVIGLLNRLGGAAVGLVLGVLICFLVAAAVKLTNFIDPSDTYLYGFFAANTPSSLLALLHK